MFAGAAREAVFANPAVVRKVKADFIPVALKAGLVNNPPDNLEGRLYREIARSKIAPQGICVVNSAGKVLAWSLMFDDDRSVLAFLDHCRDRYKEFPDAARPVAAERFMRYPGQKLAGVADTGVAVRVPEGAAVRVDPLLERGTLVGRVVGRALDKEGKPMADVLRQEHFVEARFEVPVGVQETFADALADAGKESFAVPEGLARVLVSQAYLGQLDVHPLGETPGGRSDRKEWSFRARRVPSGDKGRTLVHLAGRSDVAGTADARGRRTDGRRWEHAVKLEWEGYLELKGRRVARLLAVARGTEKLRWGNPGFKLTGEPDVAHLPAGHAIDLDCGVRYGLIAEPAAEDEVADEPDKGKPAAPRRGPGPEGRLIGVLGPRFLALQPEVWDELKLSEKGRARLIAFREDEAARLEKFLKDHGGRPDRQPPFLQRYREEADKRLDAALGGVFGAGQRQRLEQRTLRQQGLFALMDPSVAGKLEVSEGQRERLRGIVRETQERLRKLQQEAGDSPRAFQGQAAKVRAEQEARIAELLTEAQRSRWQEMIGKPPGGRP